MNCLFITPTIFIKLYVLKNHIFVDIVAIYRYN